MDIREASGIPSVEKGERQSLQLVLGYKHDADSWDLSFSESSSRFSETHISAPMNFLGERVAPDSLHVINMGQYVKCLFTSASRDHLLTFSIMISLMFRLAFTSS